jgi:hypothetical protein
MENGLTKFPVIFINGLVVFFGVHDIRSINVDGTGSNGCRGGAARREVGVAWNQFAAEELHASGHLSDFLVCPTKNDNVSGAGLYVSEIFKSVDLKF